MAQHGEEIELYWPYGDPEFIAVKGHVSRVDFASATSEHGLDLLGDEDLSHEFARWEPCSTGEVDSWLRIRPKGPGAFPVTIYRF